MSAAAHLDAFKKKYLKNGESIISFGEGYIGEMMGKGKDKQHNGILLVTEERVAFYRNGIFGEVVESIPLKSITSIERRSVLGHNTIRLHTSHDELAFKTFKKTEEEALVNSIEAGRTAVSAVGPSQVSVSPAETLRQLAGLRDAGILSEEEFQAKKTEILARL